MKTFVLFLLLGSLVACKHRYPTSCCASDSDSTKNHNDVTQITNNTIPIINHAASIKPPTNEQIKKWENMYPIFNGMSKGNENMPDTFDIDKALSKVNQNRTSIGDRASELTHNTNGDISPYDLDDVQNNLRATLYRESLKKQKVADGKANKDSVQQISAYSDFSEDAKKARGSVNLRIEYFIGNSIPITGTAKGNVTAIYVNNKKINFTPGEDLFFRVDIDVKIGYNRIPVKIINKTGKVFKSYLELNYPMENQ